MLDFKASAMALLLGGIGLFMLGASLASESLEKLAAQRLQQLFSKIRNSSFVAVVVGILITFILQSSGAVTSMLVGLGTARVIQLRGVMGVILGTAIGSTLTVQFLSLNLGADSLVPLFLASMVAMITKKPGVKQAMLAVMGFCLLFLGMSLMGSGAKLIASEPLLKALISEYAKSHTTNFIVSAVFCAFVHSSAVTVGLAMNLTQAGFIDFDQALFWVLGANVGTTSTALIAASGSNHIGKQVAWAHFFYKLTSALLFMLPPVQSFLIWFVTRWTDDPFRAIANSHLWFNVLSAVMFFPFIGYGARLIENLFPPDPKDDFATEFLKLNHYSNPSLAVSYAQREVLRVADLVLGMLRDSIHLFEHYDRNLVESLRARDKQIDFLYREIKLFLLDHANRRIGGVEKHIMELITFLTDLERAADAIDINLIQLAMKKHNLKLNFSDEGAREIRQMYEESLKAATLGINAFTEKSLCAKAIEEKRSLTRLERELREHHIDRLNRGLVDSINTSSIHLDVLNEYRRIGSLICSHAYGHI
jgi:phosphate:Na+ symporter